MAFTKSLDDSFLLEREYREWANFSNLEIYSRHSQIRGIRVEKIPDFEKTLAL